MWRTWAQLSVCLLSICVVCRNVNMSQLREGKWLEDLPGQDCDREGVGWRGDIATVVDGNGIFKNSMTVYWNRLVDRPECVDRVEIYMHDLLKVKQENPADRSLLVLDITRLVCKTEELKILVHNKRGKVLGIGKSDEDFTFKVTYFDN